MNDEIDIESFKESVRKRPGLCLGYNSSKGIIKLFSGLITDSIEICKTDCLFFKIVVSSNNKFLFEVKSQSDISGLANFPEQGLYTADFYYFSVLWAIADGLEIQKDIEGGHKVCLSFSFIEGIFTDTEIDYKEFWKELEILAMLNRRAQILFNYSTHPSQPYVNQSYFSFPDGVFPFYRRTIRKEKITPTFELFFDQEVEGNNYQIALAYSAGKQFESLFASFANNTFLISMNSLSFGGF